MLDIIQVENRSRATAGARQAAKLDERNPLTFFWSRDAGGKSLFGCRQAIHNGGHTEIRRTPKRTCFGVATRNDPP
jgi:hypothetical protein